MLQAGKVQNLRRAAACLNGLAISRGEVFSFWLQVPRPTRGRGFAGGRELREGCLVPSIGGGLCQLSNSLYEVALAAGCEIVERHPHSRQVPGSMAAAGRDATVFWNYVDLRFRPLTDCRLEVSLTQQELIVRLHASELAFTASGKPSRPGNHFVPAPSADSCETCGITSCFRHPERPDDFAGVGLTAWLVDAWWPEFDLYLRQHRGARDWLFLPLASSRFHVGNYRWDTQRFAQVRQAPLETWRRSLTCRRLAAQGAERQRTLLRFDRELAERYARTIPAAALHLVISQTLLPHLWQAGVLGGRTYDVFMTRLPISALEETLDRAALRHPHSLTLADFRAPADLMSAEADALAEARHWITPHSAIARLAGERAMKLPWQIPPSVPAAIHPGSDLLFPASTLARKGAFELAEAARALGLRVQLGGPVLERGACWEGVKTIPAAAHGSGVGAIVLPAWVEHQPRRLLQAVAAGLPVVASEECGLADVPGVITVPAGDPALLAEALSKLSKNPVNHLANIHNLPS